MVKIHLPFNTWYIYIDNTANMQNFLINKSWRNHSNHISIYAFRYVFAYSLIILWHNSPNRSIFFLSSLCNKLIKLYILGFLSKVSGKQFFLSLINREHSTRQWYSSSTISQRVHFLSLTSIFCLLHLPLSIKNEWVLNWTTYFKR